MYIVVSGVQRAVCTCVHVSQPTSDGKRQLLGVGFLLSLWIPGIKALCSGFCSKHFYPVSLLTASAMGLSFPRLKPRSVVIVLVSLGIRGSLGNPPLRISHWQASF